MLVDDVIRHPTERVGDGGIVPRIRHVLLLEAERAPHQGAFQIHEAFGRNPENAFLFALLRTMEIPVLKVIVHMKVREGSGIIEHHAGCILGVQPEALHLELLHPCRRKPLGVCLQTC